jgi:plastocyanin
VRTLSVSRLAAGLGAGVLVLGVAACGSDSADDSGSAATDSTSAAATSSASTSGSASDSAGGTLTATEDDFSIALASDSVPPGTYELTVDNAGDATHSLSITGPGGVDMTSDTLQGGDSTTMTVTLQAGEYEVWCPIGNHKAMGMDTTLTVG